MARSRVDGHKFENEFEKVVTKMYLTYRIHTPGRMYSGLTQPADFLVAGKNLTVLVEVKETSADSFSITSMQQYDEMKKFVEAYDTLGPFKNTNYIIIVHFIKHNKFVALTAHSALKLSKMRKALRPETEEVYTLVDDDLKTMLENMRW